MNRRLRICLSLAASATALFAASEALATNCVDLPAPVYVTGSSASQPLLQNLGKELAKGGSPITIVYRPQGSCLGIDAILHGTPVQGAGASAAIYWNTNGDPLSCDIDAAGVSADIGISDVFAETCYPGESLSNTMYDFPGPVQTMTFVVPGDVKESISYEAAYFVFGFGSSSGVAPWTDNAQIFRRSQSSGTQQMIAKAIGVPPDQFQGSDAGGSGALATSVLACGTAGNTGCIGILATDVAQDDNLFALSGSILAYQHKDQTCGYYPDSIQHGSDKANVRDGHYWIWGPLHILTKVSINDGNPVNPNAKVIIDSLIGAIEVPNQDFIKTQWSKHVVPQCAMRVRRTEEVGALSSFMPTRSCACKYDALSGNEHCQTCMKDSDCPASASKCNFGYCEIQ